MFSLFQLYAEDMTYKNIIFDIKVHCNILLFTLNKGILKVYSTIFPSKSSMDYSSSVEKMKYMFYFTKRGKWHIFLNSSHKFWKLFKRELLKNFNIGL